MADDIQFTHNDYEVLEREVLYQGIFRVARYHIRRKLFNGNWSKTLKFELLERRSAAAVLPYDPVLDRVILIEQFRIGSMADPKSPWIIEVPAGILEKDEKPAVLAYREAKEEANCDLLELEKICECFVSPGGSNEYITVFCGKVDSSGINGVFGLENENEDIRVLNVSAEEAFTMLRSGLIKTPPAIISLMWLQLHRKRLQENW